MTFIRPPAVPLVTVDPYFSVWSMTDRLTDDFTRHWTGKRHAMTGLIMIDGVPWRFAGKVEPNPENYYAEPKPMTQQEVNVTPLTTVYRFEAAGVGLDVSFTTPLLLDDLDVLSRPASYVRFSVRSIDARPHRVQIYFDVTGEWCVNSSDQKVVSQKEEIRGLDALRMSHEEQAYLNRSGDDLRIDWGQFYLAVNRSPEIRTFIDTADIRKQFVRKGDIASSDRIDMPQAVRQRYPVMALVWDCGELWADPVSNTAVLAYDDEYAIEYFGDKLQAYWKRNGMSAADMLSAAFAEYAGIMARCDAFDRQLREEGVRAGGEKYAELLALAYRQAIAAHKLVTDRDGNILFMSKECFSNGCIATVDVSYPSVPLFLLYNPELVKGMMRPIFKYAASDAWPFEFAPHDVGQYPLANGQVYANNAREGQMPVEECGNMLVMAAAVALAENSSDFAQEHWELLSRWANYLLEHGMDPENQLCTDDFAGHLARNANLSIKAIMGIASCSLLLDRMGRTDEAERYSKAAKEMAIKWSGMADDRDHYVLAFERAGTWSLKYNLVWDYIFGTHLFDEAVAQKEVAWYLAKGNEFGIPLDSRAAYTKADWLVWAATLASEQDQFIRLIEPLWDALNETHDRVPFTDWYDTKTARQVGFQHRSVVGGIYIKLLKDKWVREHQK
ncbi:glutaminase family protein [Paenibacillus thermotolerans]|uniref:glutaminase family protein n=1 Tax=Paenibacillus thermotolerans TaxID=3027807 RepID=UPI002368C067|nr:MULTISPECIES: glutaminase family protein [unclassified Paenibacillus]